MPQQDAQVGPVLLVDVEANGLLDKVSQIHCMVVLDVVRDSSGCLLTKPQASSLTRYRPHQIPLAIERLKNAQTLVGHNLIGYDLPALWKCRGGWNNVPLVLDTLVVSRFLWPERPWGHSLGAWGQHLGNEKIDFHDYEEFSEEMLEYCAQDVLVNYDVLVELEKEHGSPLQGYSVY